MSAQAYVFLAEGFEEVEAITPIDFLRRAGVEVRSVAVGAGSDNTVVGSHGIPIVADMGMKDVDVSSSNYDALICPGGMPGAANLADDKDLLTLLKKAHAAGKYVAAICAAPALVFGADGAAILEGRNFTCFPGLEERAKQGKHSTQRVVVDGKLITSQSAGSAAEFTVELIRHLVDGPTAEKVRQSTVQNF